MCMQLKKRSEGDRKGPTTGNSSSGTDYKSSISVELSRVDSRFKSNSNNFDIMSENTRQQHQTHDPLTGNTPLCHRDQRGLNVTQKIDFKVKKLFTTGKHLNNFSFEQFFFANDTSPTYQQF